MTTIFEQAADALETLSVPYGQDTYLAADGSLPDTYLVYAMVDGVPAQHADDAETEREYRIQVSLYSRDGLVSLPDVDAAMTAAGFTRGPERNLPYNPDTGHFGLAKDYFYLE